MRIKAGQELRYRTPGGEIVRATVKAEEPHPQPGPVSEHLRVQRVTLTSVAQQVVRALTVVDNDDPEGAASPGYGNIDNEAMAGMRLARWNEVGLYPPQFSRLVGIEVPGDAPLVLLEPYRGEAIAEQAGMLAGQARRDFCSSLLAGLRIMSASGIAHCAITPATVRWDGKNVQFTHFCHSSLIGTPRIQHGTAPWAAPEQRAPVSGMITDRDDVWAAGLVLFYAETGDEISHYRQLAQAPELKDLLAEVLEREPEQRPYPVDLLRKRQLRDPAPRPLPTKLDLSRGREQFQLELARRDLGKTGVGDSPLAPMRPSRRWFGRQSTTLGLAMLAAMATIAVILLMA